MLLIRADKTGLALSMKLADDLNERRQVEPPNQAPQSNAQAAAGAKGRYQAQVFTRVGAVQQSTTAGTQAPPGLITGRAL